MKKIIFALITLLIANSAIQAQGKTKMSSKPLHLSFGLDAGKATGANSKKSAFVIGGDLQVEYNVSQNFSVTASAGIDARINRGGVVNTIYYAPLLGGLRFYFSPKVYISEQAGYALPMTKGITNGLFTNVAGIGFKLNASSDILLAYKGLFKSGVITTDFNTIALRIAYTFHK